VSVVEKDKNNFSFIKDESSQPKFQIKSTSGRENMRKQQVGKNFN
jgi:hypothetical protein